MTLFVMIGQQIGLKGSLVKFFLLYWTRYVGLLAHLYAVLFSTLTSNNDPTWAVLNLVIVVLLEYQYWANGADAVTYVDPLWSQGENTLLPFEV